MVLQCHRISSPEREDKPSPASQLIPTTWMNSLNRPISASSRATTKDSTRTILLESNIHDLHGTSKLDVKPCMSEKSMCHRLRNPFPGVTTSKRISGRGIRSDGYTTKDNVRELRQPILSTQEVFCILTECLKASQRL